MRVAWLSLLLLVLGTVDLMAEPVHDPQDDKRAPNPAAPKMQAMRNSSQVSVRAVDCADYLLAGFTTSGVYEIYPFTCTCNNPVRVWCDMESDGGGWTVFLNRQEQTTQLDFNRTWEHYKQGFGSPDQEYWLGNDLIHQMTFAREYALRLDVHYTSGGNDYATYDRFRIDTEGNRSYKYAGPLSFAMTRQESLGRYRTEVSGSRRGGTSTTRCLQYLNSRYFTTLDRDYDSYNGNCAAKQGGGWWYYNCRYFNPTSTYKTSISLQCYSSSESVANLQLKIRPVICDSLVKTIHLKDNTCGCHADLAA